MVNLVHVCDFLTVRGFPVLIKIRGFYLGAYFQVDREMTATFDGFVVNTKLN